MSLYAKYKPGEKVWPATDFTGDKGFTVQADRDEADINKIVARFNKTGQLPPTYKGQPFYGDVSEMGNLQESMMKIQEAERLFMSFPAELRERFENSAVKFVEFVGDDKNYAEAVELGLVQKKPVPDGASPVPGAPVPVK